MKLYATVTSERATKGQGGNKQVEILMIIDPKRRVEVGRIIMKSEEEGYTVKYYPICGASFRATDDKNVITLLDTTKGEKKKGECTHLVTKAVYADEKLQGYECTECGEIIPVNSAYRKGTK